MTENIKVGDHVYCVVGEREGWAEVVRIYDSGRLSVGWLPHSTFVQRGTTCKVHLDEVTNVARDVPLH